jgi:plastocyanin
MRRRARTLAGLLALGLPAMLALQSPPAWAAAVTNVSASASTYSAGAKRVLDEVSFTATSAISDTGFVQLKAPTGTTFSGNAYDYVLQVGASAEYAGSVSVSPDGLGENVVAIYLPSAMSVEAGTAVHLSVYGVSNPASSTPSGQLAVSTSTDVTPVKKSFAITAASTISSVSVSTSNKGAGAAGAVDTISFKATGRLVSASNPAGCCSDPGYVRLTAPAGSEFGDGNSGDGAYTVTDGAESGGTSVEVDPEGLGNNVVDVDVPSGFSVKAGDTVQVTARGIRNPPSAVASGEFFVATSSDATIAKKPFAITAASAVSNVTATANTLTAGATMVVDEVSFKATSAMPSESECDYYYYAYYFGCGHYVELTAPAGTEFSSSANDYLFTDGTTSDFAYDYPEVDPGGAGNNVVRVYVPYEWSVAAGDTVHLAVFDVTNPASPVPGGELSVSTAADAKPVARPFAITAASAVANVSVATNNHGAGATGVVDSVSFTATHAITSGQAEGHCCGEPGYIRLTAPTGSEFKPEYYYDNYTVTDGVESAGASAVVDPEGLGDNVVDVIVPLSIKAGDTAQVTARAVGNPPTSLPGGEFAVATSSDSTPVNKPLAITAASAITNVTVTANTFAAGAKRAVDEVSFKATTAMPWEEVCAYDYIYYSYAYQCGHAVELTAPAGTEFSTNADDYLATDGTASGFAYDYVEVDPDGAGNNVVRVYLPYEMSVAAGDTVHLTVFGVTNPTSPVPAGELSISTAADAEPVAKPFAITAARAVSNVSVATSNNGAGATGVVDTVSLKASSPITAGEGGSCCGEPGYIRLTTPAGSQFTPAYYYSHYTVTDGAQSAGASVEVDPEGLGSNVVNVDIPTGLAIKAGDTVQVVAHGVTNPPTALASGEFAVATSSDATPVEKPFAIATASSVSSVSVSSQAPVAGAKRVVDEVSFKATSAMPSESECDYYYYAYYFGCGHYVELTAPAGTEFSGNADDYLFTDGTTSGFDYYYAEVDPGGAGNNVVRVYLPYEMSIAAGDTVHLTVFDVTNPASPVPGGELAISTAADTKPVAKPFAITSASSVSNVSVATSNSGAGAGGVVDTVSLKALHALTSGEADENCCGEPGYVRLTAPAGSTFVDYYNDDYTVTDGTQSASASAQVDPEELGQNVVDVYVPAGLSINAGDTVKVVAHDVTNPPTAFASGEFAVATSADSSPVTKALAITAATAVTAVSASANTFSAAAKRVVDEITFKATTAMPWEEACDYYYYAYYFGCGHFVELTAPAGTEFPSNAGDYLFVDGTAAGFAFDYTEVDPGGAGENVVRIDLPYEMSVAAGDTVHLTVFGVSNPTSPAPTGELSISTGADAKPVAKPYAITAASAVSAVSVTTSSAAAATTGVVDTAGFKALHAITSGYVDESCCGEPGYVRLVAPAGSEFAPSYSNNEYTVSDGAQSASATVQIDPEELGQNVVDVYIPAELTIKAGDTVQVVAHDVSNPPSVLANSEFTVATSSDPAPVSKPFPITATAIAQEVEPPSISGRAAVGETLTEEHAAWNTKEVTYGYQWLWCNAGGKECSPIGGETAQTYSPGAEDVGHTLVVQETATDAAGTSKPANSLPTAVVVPPAPTNTAVPTISGTARQGQTLTEVHGSWTGEPTSFDYQWLQCDSLGMSCTAIPDANEQTYMPEAADVSGTIEVQETAINSGGASEPAVSAPTAVLGGAPPASTAPPTITGEAHTHAVLAVGHGDWTNEPTGYEEQWLRCEASGANCQPITGADLSSYTLTSADDGHAIAVRETASNTDGAGAPATSSAVGPVELAPLRASAGEQVDATVGVPVRLDASGSSPASEITGYDWSLGDGASAEGSQVTHAYASAGTYGATVTIHRGAESASAQVEVVVAPVPSRSVAITVLGTGGALLKGAQVVYMGASGHRIEAVSGTNGVAALNGLPDGEDTVYAWASEYQPATGHVTVSGGEGASSVSLTSGALASSSVKSHEMTLAEIEAAGINTSDPANKRVFEFEIDLAFFEPSGSSEPPPQPRIECDINSAGEFVGPCLGGPPGRGGHWGYCTAGECQWSGPPPGGGGPGGPVGTCCDIVAIPKVVEGHPLIEWLVLRGTATILKQFFTVTMVTQNLSPEPFKLAHGSATLNLPSGLSLAPTATPQSLTESVPDIQGLGTATSEWVVRGDQTGEWPVSADYDGTLEPFDAPVEIEAALATPIKVWGVEALALTVKADSSALEEGVPYHVTVGITNNAEVPMYNVELALDAKVHANFDFQPEQTYGDTIRELAPGQTLYSPEYILVPDAASVGKFNPELSSATFVGEEVHPGKGIEAVAPPPVYGMSAAKAKNGEAFLKWEAVPGAEGYEVFSTSNLETAFPEVPDEVTTAEGSTVRGEELPANATFAYVPEGGWQFFAVSAIIDGAPRLESKVANTWPTTAYDYESSSWPSGGYGYRFENERMSSTSSTDTYTAQAGLTKAEVLRSSDLQAAFTDWPTNAVQAAKAMASIWEGMEGGVCYGLALSGGRFDSGADEIYSPTQDRGDSAWKVPTTSPPATRQLEAPVGPDKEYDRQFLRLTADDFATQLSAEVLGSIKAQHAAFGTSATGVRALEEQLVNEMRSGNDRYSSLAGPSGTGLAIIGLSHGDEGHAVLAYSEEAFEDGTFKIDVWNNDVPGDPPVPGVPEHIIVNPDGTWTSDIPGFEGPYSLNEGFWEERGWLVALPLYSPSGLHYSPASGASAQIAAGTTIASASESGGETPAIWALSEGNTGDGPLVADFASTDGRLVLEGEHPATTIDGPDDLLMAVHGPTGVLDVDENTGAGSIEAGNDAATLEVTRAGLAVTGTGIEKLGVSANGSVSATAGAAGNASLGIEVEHDGAVTTDALYHGSTTQGQIVEFSKSEVEAVVADTPPAVTGVSPSSGPQAGGEVVTITGTGLGAASAVKFGASAASEFTVTSPTSIAAVAPAGKGEVDITVTTPAGTSATGTHDRFTYATGAAPTVAKLSAKKGPAAGRTAVTITGTGFTAVKAVEFGTIDAASFEVLSSTTISALTPAETTGTVHVTVTTPGGTSAVTSKAKFEFEGPTVTSVSPRSGPTSGGTTVTVAGSGFALGDGTVFELGKADGTSVDCTSTTTCTMLAPAAVKGRAGAVDVRAKAGGKTSKKNPAEDQYTYVG